MTRRGGNASSLRRECWAESQIIFSPTPSRTTSSRSQVRLLHWIRKTLWGRAVATCARCGSVLVLGIVTPYPADAGLYALRLTGWFWNLPDLRGYCPTVSKS